MQRSPSLSVLLVDDEPKLRRAWERLFAEREDMRLVGSLGRADGLNDIIDDLNPAVIVIDLTMHGADPIDAIRKVSTDRPTVRCIAYSGRSEPEILRAVLDSGAWGFVDKLASPDELFDAILKVANGDLAFPPHMDIAGNT